jgi:hypothetical protein
LSDGSKARLVILAASLIVPLGCFEDSNPSGMSSGGDSTGPGSSTTNASTSAGTTTTSATVTTSPTDATSTTMVGSSGDPEPDPGTTGEPFDESLVLWLDFEDDPQSGAFLDLSGNDYDAMCSTECPTQTGGPPGRGMAADFNGTGNRLTIDTVPLLDISDAITFAAWVRLDGLPPDGSSFAVVFAREADGAGVNPYSIYLQPPTGFRVAVQGQPSVASEDQSEFAAAWRHLAGTWSAEQDRITLYVDGVALMPASAQAPPVYGPDGVTIGGEIINGSFTNAFDGAIDELRVYNRVLDSSEIAALAER